MKANHAGQVNARRIKVLETLKEQLKSGTKTEKVSKLTLVTTGSDQIPLEEKDVTRIKKEITILESKIMSPEVAKSLKPKKYRGPR
jgi:hypothetical protein